MCVWNPVIMRCQAAEMETGTEAEGDLGNMEQKESGEATKKT